MARGFGREWGVVQAYPTGISYPTGTFERAVNGLYRGQGMGTKAGQSSNGERTAKPPRWRTWV